MAMLPPQLKGFLVTARRLFKKPITIQYPDERKPLASRFRGMPALRSDPDTGRLLCVDCGLCEQICPTGAIVINVVPTERDEERNIVEWTLKLGRCMFCGLCARVCPVDAVTMSRHYELASQQRDQFFRQKGELAILGQDEPGYFNQ
jgi:NADH-quinone oxidoreductase chain I